MVYEDGYSVYLDEFLTEVYNVCDERPTDPSLKSLINTHAKCLKLAKGLKPIITIVEGEEKGKVLLLKDGHVYVLECKDVSRELIEDPTYADVLAVTFNDEGLADELTDADKVIICTIKKRKLDKKEVEELRDFTNT